MIDKLESSGGDSDSKQVLLQNLESKVLTFQTQLRTVREQIDKGADSLGDGSTAHVPTHSYAAPYHVGGGFGRHQQQQQSLGGRRGRGRGGSGPGRIIYGGRRGAAARMSNSVYIRSDITPSVIAPTVVVATKKDLPHIDNSSSAISDPEPPHNHNHLEGEIVGSF